MDGLDASAFKQACQAGGPLIERWLRRFDAQHGPALYREAAAVLKSWQRAEDVVQDTLIKVWQRCATFRGEAQPLTWVRQILRHALLDVLRAQPPEEALQDDDGELTPQARQAVAQLSVQTIGQPDQQLDEQLQQALYRQCWQRFAQAHPEQATVLRWVVEDGLGPSDVAVLLGRSPGATREYLSQCRKKARPYWDEWRRLVHGAQGRRPTEESASG